MKYEIKNLAYRFGRQILWYGWNKYKKSNRKSVQAFSKFIQEIQQLPVGTIDDGFGGGTSEIKYRGQNLITPNYSTVTYDQREFTNIIGQVGCFGYGNLNNAVQNLDITFTKKEREDFSKQLIATKGYRPQWGGYFSEGADETNTILNKKGVEYIRYYFTVNYSTLKHVLSKGLSVAMPINVSQNVLNGLFDNGVLEASEVSGATSFGHLMNIKAKKDGTLSVWIDNYPETKTRNIFTIENLEALVQSGKFMRTARFYAPIQKPVPEVVEPVVGENPALKFDNYELAVKLGFISSDNPNTPATRKEVGAVVGRAFKAISEEIRKISIK